MLLNWHTSVDSEPHQHWRAADARFPSWSDLRHTVAWPVMASALVLASPATRRVGYALQTLRWPCILRSSGLECAVFHPEAHDFGMVHACNSPSFFRSSCHHLFAHNSHLHSFCSVFRNCPCVHDAAHGPLVTNGVGPRFCLVTSLNFYLQASAYFLAEHCPAPIPTLSLTIPVILLE